MNEARTYADEKMAWNARNHFHILGYGAASGMLLFLSFPYALSSGLYKGIYGISNILIILLMIVAEISTLYQLCRALYRSIRGFDHYHAMRQWVENVGYVHSSFPPRKIELKGDILAERLFDFKDAASYNIKRTSIAVFFFLLTQALMGGDPIGERNIRTNALILAFFIVWMIITIVRKHPARSLRVEADRELVRPGETLRWSVSAPDPDKITKIKKIMLICLEKKKAGAGALFMDDQEYSTFSFQDLLYDADKDKAPELPGIIQGSVTIPADSAPSRNSEYYERRWGLAVTKKSDQRLLKTTKYHFAPFRVAPSRAETLTRPASDLKVDSVIQNG